MKERFRVILNKTIEGLKNEKSKKSSRTIFEQSQLIFNYLGLCYIHGLKSGIWNCSLTTQERRLIENAFGYFSLFDYMVLFWIKKMKIVIDIKDKIVEPLNKVEETYLYTHFFLTETDYFNKESKENNIEDLIKNVDFVIKEDLGDLVAELYWSLLYYHFKDDKIIPILRNYLKDKFISVESFEFSNYSEREKRHCKYSFICAFLEEMKQREIRYE